MDKPKYSKKTPMLKVRVSEEIMEMELKNGGYALFDKEDWDKVNQFNWRRRDDHNTSYAYAVKLDDSSTTGTQKSKYFLMHRVILGLTDPKIEVDHKNHNGLDNRKINLKPCSHAENMKNILKSKPQNYRLKRKDCPNGHTYTSKTLFITREGWRRCRICRKNSEIKYIKKYGKRTKN